METNQNKWNGVRENKTISCHFAFSFFEPYRVLLLFDLLLGLSIENFQELYRTRYSPKNEGVCFVSV